MKGIVVARISVCIVYISVFLFGSIMNHRIRHPILRTVYEKSIRDIEEKSTDHSFWYTVDIEKLNDNIKNKFVLFDEDEETKYFLAQCVEKSDQIFTQMYHLFSSFLLGWVMTKTSINGLLRRGSMFIFSKKQFEVLMDIDENWPGGTLLDLGAGDGHITQHMAPYFSQVYTTETSGPMTWRLFEKGYHVIGIDEWTEHHEMYDVISILNLLDRCEKPLHLMQNIRKCIKKEGKVILAVVFPYKPYVEFGGINNKPLELMEIQGNNFEEQINSFTEMVIRPSGFIIEKVTKLPYLCEGDLDTSFYLLFDAVFVLSIS